jgi:hypothetical protein
MEGFFAALNVETDGIHDAERAADSAADWLFVMDICCNGLQPRIMGAGRFWTPGGDANGEPLVMQMAHNAAPQKTSAAKYGHKLHHATSRR